MKDFPKLQWPVTTDTFAALTFLRYSLLWDTVSYRTFGTEYRFRKVGT